jgi:hypothetical protein
MKTKNKLGRGHLGAIAILALVLIGGAVSCTATEDGTRGDWPDIPCPATPTDGQPQAMVSQRLTEIKQALPNSAPPATPEQMQQVTMLCDQVMAENPADPAGRSDAVHRAYVAATATPPNWAAVVQELTGAE